MADSRSVSFTGRQIIGRMLKRILAIGVLGTAFAFVVDYGILRFRMASNRTPFSTVTVHPLLAVPHKDHRVEFMPDAPQDQTCVNALFPHLGDSPCWYLIRHTRPQIDM